MGFEEGHYDHEDRQVKIEESMFGGSTVVTFKSFATFDNDL